MIKCLLLKMDTLDILKNINKTPVNIRLEILGILSEVRKYNLSIAHSVLRYSDKVTIPVILTGERNEETEYDRIRDIVRVMHSDFNIAGISLIFIGVKNRYHVYMNMGELDFDKIDKNEYKSRFILIQNNDGKFIGIVVVSEYINEVIHDDKQLEDSIKYIFSKIKEVETIVEE